MSDPAPALLEPLGEAAPIDDDGLLTALVEVERALALAWGDVADAGGAAAGGPDASGADAARAASVIASATLDRAELAAGSRADGMPVPALSRALRRGAEAAEPGLGAWVHRGVTSQDVLDTALVLAAQRQAALVRAALAEAGSALARIADAERDALCLARTLGQQAGVTTCGVVAASWLDGVSSAIDALDALGPSAQAGTRAAGGGRDAAGRSGGWPVQLGGSTGTGEAIDVLAGRTGASGELRTAFAARLGLADPGRAWHTERTPMLRIGGAAAAAVAAAARIGRDLVLLSRGEIAEVVLAHGGGSSAMPHKRNPVDAVLLVANGLRAPGALSTLHVAAVSSDQRPAGEWHAEWAPFRDLWALALGSARALASATDGLVFDHDASARNLRAAGDAILAERAAAERLAHPDTDPALGPEPVIAASAGIVGAAIDRFERLAREEAR